MPAYPMMPAFGASIPSGFANNWGMSPAGPMTTMGADMSSVMGGSPGYNLTTPGVGLNSTGGMFGGGLGANMETAKLGLAGLGTIGNLWAAFNAQKLAKEQFNFTKNVAETNLGNQIKSYNTGLDDKIRSRAAVEGMSSADAAAYTDKHKLTR